MLRPRLVPALGLLAVVGVAAAKAPPEIAPPPRPAIDLTGYATPNDAIPADPEEFAANLRSDTAAGFLGVVVGSKDGRPVIEAVAPDSPADRAGLRAGDEVTKIDAGEYGSADTVRDALRSRLAGERLTLTVLRDEKPVEAVATLDATSRPIRAEGDRAILGVRLRSGTGSGITIDSVTPDGAADKGGVKAGDRLVKFDGKNLDGPDAFRELMADRRPGDVIDVIAERKGGRVELRVTLGSDTRTARAGGWDDRIPRTWRKPAYTLAILGVEYPDVKHNPKIADADWEESMFSLGTYTGKSATGSKVYGSMNDYYRELSHGTFRVNGKFLGWTEVAKKRMDYTTGSGTSSNEKRALLVEALAAYTKEHGEDALKEYDGIFFVYAGGRVQTTRGGLYWPHRANISFGGKRWPYFIVQEGGPRMNDISVFCHEFGHMLGLPDLYARPELPGSEGVGVWCAMSNQAGGGRPQHFSAWCKEQLGWAKPVVIDPRVRQKLILAPIEDDPTQCYKVMVRADGSEYFLLENRRKTGFDTSLPGEGLLIWRVVNGRPVLEESHGVEGASGPRVHLGSVPYPSASNAAFTPYTTPTSKSQLGGGLPVYVTNIRTLPDGRVTFHIGYEYQ